MVVFDHGVDVLARSGTGGDQADLSQVLRSVHAGGMTNLSGGWLKGRELVASGLLDGGVNRVLLLTDGLANQGIVEPEALVGLACSAAADRITTTTLGFGEGFDEALLQAMADGGGGNAYYIERPDQAGDVFGAEREGLLGVVAQHLSMTLHPGPDSQFVRVLHDYPFEERGTELRLDVGDVYAREPRRLLADFLVPAAAVEEGADAELARFEVRADVVLDGGSVERREIDLPVRVSLEKGGRVEPEVRREMLSSPRRRRGRRRWRPRSAGTSTARPTCCARRRGRSRRRVWRTRTRIPSRLEDLVDLRNPAAPNYPFAMLPPRRSSDGTLGKSTSNDYTSLRLVVPFEESTIMTRVGSYEARTHLSDLLRRVERGERITITRHGHPVAELVPPGPGAGADVGRVVDEIRDFGAGRCLGSDLTVRDLIDEGRKR